MGGQLYGKVKVPGDKSISHRALLFGSISEGITTIEGLLPAEDPISTAACLRSMGVKIMAKNNIGVISQVMGAVVDVKFDGNLPEPEINEGPYKRWSGRQLLSLILPGVNMNMGNNS